METKESKLKRHLAYGGFSALLLFLVVSSCCYNVEADYSFENKLKDEVRLTLYSSGSNIKGTKDYNIVEGGIIMLVSLKTCDRDGFGDVIGNEVDSAKVVLSDSSKVIAIWRASGEHFLSESYENLPDFFDWWYWEENRIQHGGSHAEYRYILELIDK